MTPLQLWKMCRRARGDGKHLPPYGHGFFADRDYCYAINIGGVWHIFIDGSSNFREWMENLAWFRTGKTKSSIGFRNAAVEFYQQLTNIIPTNSPIVIAGPSRGGAISQSLGLIMENRGYNVSRIVSFGAPKVGGKRFCECMSNAHLHHERYVMQGDIVPRLPFFRGRHYDTEYILIKNNLRGRVKKHLGYGAFLKGED